MAKKKAIKKAARPDKTAARASSASRVARKVVKKKPAAKPVAAKPPAARKPIPAPALAPAPKPPVVKVPVVVAEPEPENPARKKGVRKATITTGIRDAKPVRKLGRSRIPVDAPLDVVFQNDLQAKEAFMFLGIHSIRELEQFNPDDLVLRLTGPAKLTVGRIRKILAMNNRCLTGDEEFALEFQELLSRPRE
jgi:hypothetical protein